MTDRALRVLSLIPPMTQLNTPYPSTAYLTGFLRSRGVDARQADLALALVLRLFTPQGLDDLRDRAQALPEPKRSASLHAFLDQFETSEGHSIKPGTEAKADPVTDEELEQEQIVKQKRG